ISKTKRKRVRGALVSSLEAQLMILRKCVLSCLLKPVGIIQRLLIGIEDSRVGSSQGWIQIRPLTICPSYWIVFLHVCPGEIFGGEVFLGIEYLRSVRTNDRHAHVDVVSD